MGKPSNKKDKDLSKTKMTTFVKAADESDSEEEQPKKMGRKSSDEVPQKRSHKEVDKKAKRKTSADGKKDTKKKEKAKKEKAPSKKSLPKKQAKSDSDSEEETTKKNKKEAKKTGKGLDKKPKVVKKVSSSESESSDEEPTKPTLPKVTKGKATKAPAKPLKKVSDSESSDDEPVKAPVKTSAKPQPKKKVSDSESSDEEAPKKKAKGSDSDSSDSPPPTKQASLKRKIEEPDTSHKKMAPAEEIDVYVGGLAYASTEDDIRQFFATCGDIKGLRLLKDNDGNSRGTAFLKFDTKEEADRAVSFNDSDFMGRYLKVHVAEKRAPAANPGGVTTLFIGNIPYDATEEDFYDVFQDNGAIKGVRIAKHPDGSYKGFAHLEFHGADSADKAMSKGVTTMKGRNLRMDFSGDRASGGSPTKSPQGFRFTGNDDKPKEKARNSGTIQNFQGKKVTF